MTGGGLGDGEGEGDGEVEGEVEGEFEGEVDGVCVGDGDGTTAELAPQAVIATSATAHTSHRALALISYHAAPAGVRAREADDPQREGRCS